LLGRNIPEDFHPVWDGFYALAIILWMTLLASMVPPDKSSAAANVEPGHDDGPHETFEPQESNAPWRTAVEPDEVSINTMKLLLAGRGEPERDLVQNPTARALSSAVDREAVVPRDGLT